MLRAVISISQRGKLPLTLMSTRSIDESILVQNKLLYTYPFIRPHVRCASNDNKIKGSINGTPSGIIGNVGQSTNMGSVSSSEAAFAQPAALGTDPTRDDSFCKQTDKKTGDITSQMHATPSVTEHGKIRPDDLAVGSKDSSKTGHPSKEVSNSGSNNNLSDDVIKQLQVMAANLPSKEQVEKVFFRVVAFIYDIVLLTANWTIRFVDQKILQNNTVKLYWKRFHEKMEQAKKD